MKQYAFFINSDNCVACKTCVAACKDKNNLPPGRKFRRVYSMLKGSWRKENTDYLLYMHNSDVSGYNLPIGCNHCESPACRSGCPANAIGKRDDGIVFIDSVNCNGCGSCAIMCPYGAPSMDWEAKKAQKCDFCMDQLAEGEPPTCVAACPVRCLDFGELEELKARYPAAVRDIPPLPDSGRTIPSVVILTSRKYDSGGLYETMNFPEEIQAHGPQQL